MAEKSVMLTFQNNCETINSNCVEVENGAEEKNPNNDITEINTNKSEDKPNGEMTGSETQEDAVEKFLAGESKNDFNDDLLLENIEAENEGIDFKSDNVIMDCPELDKSGFFEGDEDGEEEKGEGSMSPGNSIEENLETENQEW